MVKIEENVPLASRTTFRVGGPAQYFATVTTAEGLLQARDFARQHNLRVMVLGAGSNLIFPDVGYQGLVIEPRFTKLELADCKATVGTGVMIDDLVKETTSRGWAGLEWAGGLPGTIGGAIRGNAGAFQGETKDNLRSATSLVLSSGEQITRSKEECAFHYRDSIFKHRQEVILEAVFCFDKGDKKELEELAEQKRTRRQERLPLDLPNAGSIFKNVALEKVPEEVQKRYREAIKSDPFPVMPAAKLIAEAGLAGKQIGQAQISPKHTNFIVNLGGAKTLEIRDLIALIQTEVREKYAVELEVEPEIVQ